MSVTGFCAQRQGFVKAHHRLALPMGGYSEIMLGNCGETFWRPTAGMFQKPFAGSSVPTRCHGRLSEEPVRGALDGACGGGLGFQGSTLEQGLKGST